MMYHDCSLCRYIHAWAANALTRCFQCLLSRLLLLAHTWAASAMADAAALLRLGASHLQLQPLLGSLPVSSIQAQKASPNLPFMTSTDELSVLSTPWSRYMHGTHLLPFAT
jgi:hypothetical protein